MEPKMQFYGDRTYRARDPEGHIWTFSVTVKRMSTAEWDKVSGFTTKQRLDWVTLAAAGFPVMAQSRTDRSAARNQSLPRGRSASVDGISATVTYDLFRLLGTER